MTDVLVRNIPEETLERLKEKAGRNHRSLQQELRLILTQAAHDQLDELVDRIREERIRYDASGHKFSDSTKLIRRDRNR